MVRSDKYSWKRRLAPYLKNPQVLGVILIALVIPLTYYVVSQQTRTRQDAALTDTFITPGTMNLTATFNSVGIELFFDGDANKNAIANLEFKKKNEATWRKGLDLWGTYSATTPGPAFYGSALLLEPGTEYDVKITVSDPDGVTGTSVHTKSITTRADNIPAASTLNPTHFVRTDGNDANAGTSDSPTGAWKTLNKAVQSAPNGAVVQVGPGYFARPSSARTTPLTLVAQYPAIDDKQNDINPGQHTVIEPAAVSSPTGAAGPNPGVWQQVTMTGPGYAGALVGATYNIWKWQNSGVTSAEQLGFSSTRQGQPKRVAHWNLKGPELSTPEGWVEKLYTNKSFNYGFASFGQDLYLRIPGDLNPNSYYITAGAGNAFTFSGSNIRVSGFEIRQFTNGIEYTATSSFGVVDHTLLSGNGANIRLTAAKGSPSVYGTDHTIQNNRFADSNLWNINRIANSTVPWLFIKGSITNADGTQYPYNRLGDKSEVSAIFGRGFAIRTVFRNNTVDGGFDGLTGYDTEYDRYSAYDTDIYNNTFRNLSDDVSDISYNAINLRLWNNKIENVKTVLSTGPIHYGPVYFFRNTAWKVGNEGVGLFNNQNPESSTIFKYSGSSNPIARVYVVNNTLWTNDSIGTNGGAKYAGGSSYGEAFYLRNNIIRSTQYAFSAPFTPVTWNENYNHFATSDASRGLQYGAKYTTNVEAYRSASGQGSNTNVSGDFVTTSIVDNSLIDPSVGDLNLSSSSPFINIGTVVPNISDNYDAKSSYIGAAPDLGAIESGGTGSPTIPTATPTAAQGITPTPTTPMIATPTVTSPPVGGVNPATTLAVSPGLISVTATKSYLSSIQINTQNSVTNTDLSFTFNPAIMEVTDLTLGNFLPNAQVVTKTIDNVNGKAFISFYTDSANAKTGSGNLAYIAWKPKLSGSNTISFDPATTIVYGLGGGNVVSELVPATYNIPAPTGPTATPTTTVPTATNTPIPPTSTPVIATCAIGTASWNLSSVDEGTLVTLRATVTGTGCAGKQVTFKVRENDSILEGGLDEDASSQPAAAVVSGSTATTTWIAEWQNDCNGLCNSPEYYFNATLAGGNTVRSADPLLSVQKTETAVTLKLTLPYLSESQDMLNSTVTIRNTQTNTDVSKTVTLVPGTNNTYTGTLQTVLTPGNYAMLVKRHQFLAKRFTFTVGSTAPSLDFCSTPLVGGDINNDNVINTLDLGKVIEEYSPQADTTAVSDLTRDKRINALDLGIIIENYFKQGETL